MKKVLTLTMLIMVMSISVCFATDSVSLTQSFYDNFKNEFIPAIKNQLFPMIFDFLQMLIYTLIMALLAYVANYAKKLTDIKAIDDEIDNGHELMKTMINDSLNSKEYKELKAQYTSGKISMEDFYKQCYTKFKQPVIEAVSNKMTTLGKSLLQLANEKFGDGSKYLSGKLEEFLNEAKKK